MFQNHKLNYSEPQRQLSNCNGTPPQKFFEHIRDFEKLFWMVASKVIPTGKNISKIIIKSQISEVDLGPLQHPRWSSL